METEIQEENRQSSSEEVETAAGSCDGEVVAVPDGLSEQVVKDQNLEGEKGTSGETVSAQPVAAAAGAPESSETEIVSRASPALLQAVLLASGEPVSFVRLQEIMRCNRADVMSCLETLKALCDDERSGIEIVTVGERLQLRTKVAHAEPVRELLAVKPRKLSQAALETLSVVAYQQPIVKSEIDKIRGVDVAPTLKTLLERKIIKIIGYQASVGQPALYGTTEEFLRIFGLGSLSELPALRDLRAVAKEPGEVGAENEITEEQEGSDASLEATETNAANDDVSAQAPTEQTEVVHS